MRKGSRKRIDWTAPNIIERLGVDSDHALAAELGVSHQAVSWHRNRLGIKSTRPGPLSDEVIERLGTMKDVDLARLYNVNAARITKARHERGIPRYRLIGPIAIEHGTRYAYVHFFCRCTPCTATQAVHQRNWHRDHPEQSADNKERSRKKALDSAPHAEGKIGWYNFGCRCAGCKQAQVDYQTDEYKRSRTRSLPTATSSPGT